MDSPEALEGDSRPLAENRLGKYRLVAPIGRGDKADIHLAVLDGPGGFNKLLVVKELRPGSLEGDPGAHRFLDGARIAARLSHPNIVQTLEAGGDGSRRFVAMEYLEGQSLQLVIGRACGRNAPLSIQTHLAILVDVLGALGYAHSFAEFDGAPLTIVHGAVSPQKVIITYEGHVKLIDFGKTALGSAETTAGTLKGKVRYMAPEQAGGGAVDPRSDVFAVGVMLWEALVGQGPWDGETDAAIFRNLTAGKVPRLSALDSGLDEDLVAIVDRAVSADPRDRYGTASAMRDDLESCMVARGKRWPLATLRGLPTLLGTLFDDDRRELNALVDAQIGGPSDPPRQPITLTRVRTEESQPTHPAISQPPTPPEVNPSPALPTADAPLSSYRPRSWLALGAPAAAAAAAVVLTLAWERPTAKPSSPATLEPRRPAPAVAPVTSSPEGPPSSSAELRVSPPIEREGPRTAVPRSAPRAAVDMRPRVSAVTAAAAAQAPSPALSRAADPPLQTIGQAIRSKHELDREDPYAQ